jgi:1L-myo-inositol 1-phosphate cytidylyltransferase
MKSRISEAVILMAGCGSRLRGADETFLKPLLPIHGRPLVSYTIEALARSGIGKIVAIVGFESRRLGPALKKLIPSTMELDLVENRDWQKQNGISALAARSHVSAPFLLTMCDHLFDRRVVDLLIEHTENRALNLAIDKKLDSVFDLEDAMKVQTRNDRVTAIGKDLQDYDAIDTGLFVCPEEFFDYLEHAKKNGDCSLSDGVRLMAADGKVHAIDIGNVWWLDVDTPAMLQKAERSLRQAS